MPVGVTYRKSSCAPARCVADTAASLALLLLVESSSAPYAPGRERVGRTPAADVAFDEGGSLAGNESIDSVATGSLSNAPRRCRQRRPTCRGLDIPATAQPIRVAPLAMYGTPRQERRLAPYTKRPAPASETSHGMTRSSTVGPLQPRRSQTLVDARRAVKLPLLSPFTTPSDLHVHLLRSSWPLEREGGG